jgi:tetratricopeptide (TPR) repeat protein
MTRLIPAGSILALVLAAPLLAQEEDTIRLKEGRALNATVVSADYGGLVLQMQKGAQTTQPWKSVLSIEYGNAGDLTKALESFRAGNLAEARTVLETVTKDQKLRPVVKQEALYHLALAAQRLGDHDAAIAEYKELLKAFPKGRYLRSAAEGLVDAHLAKKDAAGAGKALDQAVADAKGAGVEAFQAEVGFLRGRVLEAQGKLAEAKTAYEAAQKSGAPAVQIEARLGVARCVQQTSPAEAEKAYRELVAEKDAPTHVLAGAWNGIGQLLLEDGKKTRNAEKLTDALLAFLRGVVQYVPARGEPTAEYERALASSSQCFKFIADLEQKADRKRSFLDRSQQRMEQLRKEFPSSPYLSGK